MMCKLSKKVFGVLIVIIFMFASAVIAEPIAYYSFDGTGTITVEQNLGSAGSSLDATAASGSTVAYDAGHVAPGSTSSAVFNQGANDYLATPTANNALNLPNGFEIDFWMNPGSFQYDMNYVFQKQGEYSVSLGRYPFGGMNFNRIGVNIAGQTLYFASGVGEHAFEVLEWNHVTITWDPSDNSVRCVSVSDTYGTLDQTLYTDGRVYTSTTNPLKIGSGYFGYLDEIKISAVPEPVTMSLLGMGVSILFIRKIRKNKI